MKKLQFVGPRFPRVKLQQPPLPSLLGPSPNKPIVPPAQGNGQPMPSLLGNGQPAVSNMTPITQKQAAYSVRGTGKRLDYTPRDKTQEPMWQGANYDSKWKPAVSGALKDKPRAEAMIANLESIKGKNGDKIRQRFAGKSFDEKVAMAQTLGTDGNPGDFHNALKGAMDATTQTAGLPPLPTDTPKSLGVAPVTKDLGAKKPFELPPSNNPTGVKTQAKGNGLMKALPLVTNVANMFRSAPMPPGVNLDSPITLERVNMDNDRAMSERGIRGMNMNADATMDGNSAYAAKAYNLSQRFNQMSTINQAERNQNSQIANTETLENSKIYQGNNLKRDEFEKNKVDMQIANGNARMANLSNAVDKTVGMYNEGDKARIAGNNQAIYMAGDRDGVTKRLKTQVGGNTDPQYAGTTYSTNKYGGVMRKLGGPLNTGSIMKRLKSIKDNGTIR